MQLRLQLEAASEARAPQGPPAAELMALCGALEGRGQEAVQLEALIEARGTLSVTVALE